MAPAFREVIAKRIRAAPERIQGLIREQFLRLDGTPIDVDVTTKPSIWKGRPAAYVTFRDITAQLRAEEALALFKDSADRASDQVFWVDIDGNILYVNDSACLNTGFSREELHAMNIFSFDLVVTPERWQKFVREIKERKPGFLHPPPEKRWGDQRCRNYGQLCEPKRQGIYLFFRQGHH